MIFNTLTFAIFLVITLGAYWSLREDVWRRRLLFVANPFFYGWWDWRFVPLLLGVRQLFPATTGGGELMRSASDKN